jgi:rubrerythrin
MKHKKRSPAFPLLPNESEYCTRDGKVKRKYQTQLDAELSAPVKELQQYVCDMCGYWHNGASQTKEPTRRNEQSPDLY